MKDALDHILGLSAEPGAGQMCARAVIIFFYALALIRIAGIRTMGKQSVFDMLTSLIIGSILGRSIVAEQSFTGTILACLVIVLLHRLIAWITYRSKKAGKIFKGENLILERNGIPEKKNLSRQQITEEDIDEALRTELHTHSRDDVKEIYLERSGEISFIKKETPGES